MQFAMLPERLRWWTLLLLGPAFALSACATPIVYNRPASDCSSLVPKSLIDPTPGAALPVLTDPMGPWVSFGDAQTGQLDKANVDKLAQHEIVAACEKRDREAEKAITKKPWWAFLG